MTFLQIWTKGLWLYFMLATGTVIGYTLITNWQEWSAAQKVCACIYIVLPLHACEEFWFPGGYAWQYNWIRGRSDRPDRYPMNQLTHMMMYVFGMVYGVGLLVVGANPAILATRLLVAVMELVVHLGDGVKMKKKFEAQGKKTIYNPGLVTALLGFAPVLVVGLAVLFRMSLGWKDAVGAVALLVPSVVITKAPEKIVDRSRDAEWAYQPGYYKKFVSK